MSLLLLIGNMEDRLSKFKPFDRYRRMAQDGVNSIEIPYSIFSWDTHHSDQYGGHATYHDLREVVNVSGDDLVEAIYRAVKDFCENLYYEIDTVTTTSITIKDRRL